MMGDRAEKLIESGEAERLDAPSAGNGRAPVHVAADLSLADTLPPIHGAHVSMSDARDGAHEVLMYDLTGTGILASHAASADGVQQDLYLFNKADREVYETVLRGIRYANRAPDPSSGMRQVTIDITDATAFAEPVYTARIEVVAPADIATPAEAVTPADVTMPSAIEESAQAYDLLTPDLLRQTAENIQFAAFEFAPLGTAAFSYSDAAAGADDGLNNTAGGGRGASPDRGSDLFADDGAAYTLFERAARALTDRAGDRTSLFANGRYLLFFRQAMPAAAARPSAETDLLDGRDYRLFREREPDGVRGSDAATLLVQDPDTGAWFSAPAISQISDTAPVVAINDSETRRRLDGADAVFRQAA